MEQRVGAGYAPDVIRRFARPVMLVLAVLVTYSPALRAGLIWDDPEHVVSNRALQAPDGLRRVWTDLGATPQYYPLTHSTFWIERRVLDASPQSMHAVNLILHAGNALLLRAVLAALAIPGAWLGAALFALHPLQVETVAWISERKNLLSVGLTLLAALAFLRATGPADRRRGFWIGSIAAYLAALLAKTVACTLPASLLVLARWRRRPLTRGASAMLLAMLGTGAVFAFLTIAVEAHFVGASGERFALSLAQRSVVAGRAFWFYLGKLVWPADLSFVYPRWTIDATGLQLLWPASVLMALALATRAPGLFVVLAIYGITLSPALGFFPVYPMRFSFVADHFAYLAIAAPLAGAAVAIVRLPRGIRRGLAICVLGLLGGLSFHRTQAFHGAETLWRDTLAKNPDSWLVRNNLGVLLRDDGRLAEAESHLREAVRLDPAEALSWTNLGTVLAARGDLAGAVSAHRRALALEPAYPRAMTDLGIALSRQGREDDAVEQWEQALRLRPDLTDAHLWLGRALVRQGRGALGRAHLEEALRERPGDPETRAALAEAETTPVR